MNDIKTYTKEPYIDPVDGSAKFILRANKGSVPEGKGRVHTCSVCLHEFREDNLVKFRGAWYCKPSLHVKEIASILKKEQYDREYGVDRPREEYGNSPIVLED